MRNQIFIYGHYGKKNIGDDAMIYSLVNKLNALKPTHNLAILSPLKLIVPDQNMNRIKFVNPDILSILKEIRLSSLFLMGGGTHIYDKGKKYERYKILIEIMILITCAKLFNNKIYLLNIGIEPINSYFGKLIAKIILELADFISVRDSDSFKIIKNLNSKIDVVLAFDLAALLDLPVGTNAIHETIKTLGISILPFFEIYRGDPSKDILMVDVISKSLNKWLCEDQNRLIYLFVFKDKLRYDDVAITNNLRKKLVPSNRVHVIPYDPDPIKPLKRVSQCDAFIGMRYHSCMYSYLTDRPLLIISYFDKCLSLARDIGLPAKAILSMDEVHSKRFDEIFSDFIKNPSDYTSRFPRDAAAMLAEKGLSALEV